VQDRELVALVLRRPEAGRRISDNCLLPNPLCIKRDVPLQSMNFSYPKKFPINIRSYSQSSSQHISAIVKLDSSNWVAQE
jgi:hypothetical protein